VEELALATPLQEDCTGTHEDCTRSIAHFKMKDVTNGAL
jgi:hypothetical protein